MKEASIIINGIPLEPYHAETLRVAISSFLMEMSHDDALGVDEHGKKMAAFYFQSAREIESIIFKAFEGDEP